MGGRLSSPRQHGVGPLIKLSDVDVTYVDDGDPVDAVRGISLTVGRGEFVSVVGPSGCGKTTLLRVIAGLRLPTAGRVWLGGRAVTGPVRDVGLVFQKPILLPWRTAVDNVMLPVEVLGLDADEFRERARHLLLSMGLAGFDDRYPHQLSGGMQQRVAIARALVHDPAILLMDEPFGALDAMTREALNLELLRLWQTSGKTLVFVTHNIIEAVFLSNRVVVMSHRPGRVLAMVDIELPAPRSLLVVSSPLFGEYAAEIRDLLEADNRAVSRPAMPQL